MKLSVDHYALLVIMLDKLNDKVKDCEKEMTAACNDLGHVQEAYTGQGLTLMQFRWDVLNAVPNSERLPWLNIVSYYANDAIIDAALQKYFGHEK